MIFIPIIIPGGGIRTAATTIGTGIIEQPPAAMKEAYMSRGFKHGAGCLCFAMITAIVACAGGISKQSQSQVTFFGPFSAVQQQPEKYRGETVMWGGRIINTLPGEKTTELVVLQLGLGSQNRPKDNDQSQGRFLVHSSQFLDPAIYPQGALITVVGPVKGAESRSIGQMTYRYPVVNLIEIKKWQSATDTSPRFHFGIGVGTHF
jgi:outer membrane lipoprotein